MYLYKCAVIVGCKYHMNQFKDSYLVTSVDGVSKSSRQAFKKLF